MMSRSVFAKDNAAARARIGGLLLLVLLIAALFNYKWGGSLRVLTKVNATGQLASLFVLGRETRPRIALAVAAGVWLVATAAGLAAGS